MPKVNKYDQKRLIYYAKRSEHKALVDFVKSRGLYLIPSSFKHKNFSEEDLLSGRLDDCNLSPVPFEELTQFPINKRQHENFWHTIDRKYPIISWLWTREPPGYCLDGRITWHPVSEPWLEKFPKIKREKVKALAEEYIAYNSEMKGHAHAIGRWLRKNYDNLEKGCPLWYSPETAREYQAGELDCCTFVPGSIDMTAVYIDDKGQKVGEVTTRDWKIFDFLKPRRKKK